MPYTNQWFEESVRSHMGIPHIQDLGTIPYGSLTEDNRQYIRDTDIERLGALLEIAIQQDPPNGTLIAAVGSQALICKALADQSLVRTERLKGRKARKAAPMRAATELLSINYNDIYNNSIEALRTPTAHEWAMRVVSEHEAQCYANGTLEVQPTLSRTALTRMPVDGLYALSRQGLSLFAGERVVTFGGFDVPGVHHFAATVPTEKVFIDRVPENDRNH